MTDEATELFPIGVVTITVEALALLIATGTSLPSLLSQHQSGDWGQMDEEDKRANDAALIEGGRLFSSYRVREAETVWIITEAGRTATTVLTPEEY